MVDGESIPRPGCDIQNVREEGEGRRRTGEIIKEVRDHATLMTIIAGDHGLSIVSNVLSSNRSLENVCSL